MTTTQAHSTAHDGGDENELPMNVVSGNESYDKERLFRNLSVEKVKFMWFQLLIEILFRLNCNEYDCRQMLDECRAKYKDDAAELRKMDEFQSTFKPQDATKWYTRDSFLYRLLNQAFRSENIDEIFKFRFFTHYLNKQLSSLHREQVFQKHLIVYHGKSLPAAHLRTLRNNINGLLSINTFLSTTLNRIVAEIFCGDNSVRPNMEPVIFEIHINDTTAEISQRIAYANIRNLTDFVGEEEILFSVGAVFRILSIPQNPNDPNQIWHIKLELTTEKDLEPLHKYFSGLISFGENINPVTLGKFFRLMGDFDRALRYYNMLLKQLSPDNEQLPLIYNNLATIWCGKGDWNQALMCLNQAKNLLKSMPTMPNREITLAFIYQGFAGVYKTSQQWKLGVRYGLKCLNLQSQCLPEKHPEMATTCSTLGWCYARLGEYKNASEMYHRALDIQMSKLPQCHPETASTLNNLAGLYKDTGDYEIALEHYRKAYEIFSLISPDSCHVATIYNNLGRLYAKMKNYPLSINCYEKCIELRERLGLFNHPDFCETLYSLGSLYMELTKLTEALYYYEKLSNNLLNNEQLNYYWEAHKQIGLCYYRQKQYNDAIKNYLIALGRYNDRCHEKGAIIGIYNCLAWCYFHTEKYYTSYIIFKLALLSAKKQPQASNEFEQIVNNFHVHNHRNNVKKTKALMMENNQYPLEPALRL